jgi:hypothetical protein
MLNFDESIKAGGGVVHSALRNAAEDAAFMLAAVAAKDAALEYRNDATWNTQLPAMNEGHLSCKRQTG